MRYVIADRTKPFSKQIIARIHFNDSQSFTTNVRPEMARNDSFAMFALRNLYQYFNKQN